MHRSIYSLAWFLGFLSLTVFVPSCALKIDAPPIEIKTTATPIPDLTDLVNNVQTQIQRLKLECTATVNGKATGGVPFDIAISAKGGLAPYYILDSTTKFDESTTVSRTYSNASSSDITVNDSIVIRDTIGLTTACTFSVTVQPGSGSGGPGIQYGLLVSASPGTVVSSSSAITLTASPIEFSPTSYSFTTSHSGISIVPNGNKAVIKSLDPNVTHDFWVSVKATDSNITVTRNIHLVFQAPSFGCTLYASEVLIGYHNYGEFDVEAVVSGSSSYAWIESLSAPEEAEGSIENWWGPLEAKVYITNPGTWVIEAEVRNLAGQVTYCSTVIRRFLTL